MGDYGEYKKLLCRELKKRIIAAGGGSFIDDENRRTMLDCGTVFYLSARPETILCTTDGPQMLAEETDWPTITVRWKFFSISLSVTLLISSFVLFLKAFLVSVLKTITSSILLINSGLIEL